MMRATFLTVGFLISLAVGPLAVNSQGAEPDAPERAAMARRLAAMKAQATSFTLAIYPVCLPQNKPTTYYEIADVAEAMALLFENAGLDHITVVKTAPALGSPLELDLAQTAEKFQSYVKAHPPQADYAIYAQVISIPEKFSPAAVRAVIVNRAGDIVWADEQTPASQLWKRNRPDNPLAACHLAVKTLCKPLALSGDPGKPRKTGEWNQIWDKKMAARRGKK